MPTFRCSILLDYASNLSATNVRTRRGSFSEQVYKTGTDLEAVDPLFQRLCVARAALLPKGTLIVGKKYVQVDPVGGSNVKQTTLPGSSGLDADVPQMALIMRLLAVGRSNVRPYTFRAIPDVRSVEGEYVPSQQFTNGLSAFIALLNTDGWQFRAVDMTATTAPVFSIDVDGNYVLAAPSTFAAGNFVRILRTTDANKRRKGGRFLISAAPTATTGTLRNWTFGPTAGGKMRLEGIVYPTFAPVTKVPTGEIIVKKIGRPSAGYRGRQTRHR